MADDIDHLRREIAQREAELADLKSRLAVAESESRDAAGAGAAADEGGDWKWPLGEDEYERYSRQMIVPNFGLQGECSHDTGLCRTADVKMALNRIQ